MSDKTPRFRFAPSPTGALHIGGARTALYNWLAARHLGGSMLLRIEDTDRERSTPENTAQILDALEWLQLDWDGEPVSQHSRGSRHREALESLLESGVAYRDAATSEEVKAWKAEHGTGRGYRGPAAPVTGDQGAVRLRVPNDGVTVVEDVLRGAVEFPNASMDDFVIARADGTVLYNFAVAVDDADMEITDVVRGDDHLSNTPKQLLVLDALGRTPPRYAHLPLLHGPDGKKLAKRHGAASVQELRDAGFLPSAVRNYLALLGWGTTDDTTLMSTEELVRRFAIADVGTASAIFDEKKLRWMNGRFMREMPITEYADAVHGHLERSLGPDDGAPPDRSDERFLEACSIAQEKAQTLDQVWPLIRFAFRDPVDDEKAWRKVMKDDAPELLAEARTRLGGMDSFAASDLEAGLAPIAEQRSIGAGKVYQPIRVAITGTTISPGIFESLQLLGRDRSLERIDAALARLSH